MRSIVSYITIFMVLFAGLQASMRLGVTKNTPFKYQDGTQTYCYAGCKLSLFYEGAICNECTKEDLLNAQIVATKPTVSKNCAVHFASTVSEKKITTYHQCSVCEKNSLEWCIPGTAEFVDTQTSQPAAVSEIYRYQIPSVNDYCIKKNAANEFMLPCTYDDFINAKRAPLNFKVEPDHKLVLHKLTENLMCSVDDVENIQENNIHWCVASWFIKPQSEDPKIMWLRVGNNNSCLKCEWISTTDPLCWHCSVDDYEDAEAIRQDDVVRPGQEIVDVLTPSHSPISGIAKCGITRATKTINWCVKNSIINLGSAPVSK